MHMGIDQAWRDKAAACIDYSSRGHRCRENVSVVADCAEFPVFNCRRFGARESRIRRENACVTDDELRR
jgi:hypothetical protein